MFILGLTGSIASGKSTVSKMIRRQGIPVICADKLARHGVRRGTPANKKIFAAFGKIVFRKDGSINRDRLAAEVFRDSKKRKILNSIVHPEVMKIIKDKISKYEKRDKKMVVLDIPLLFEEKREHLCDKTLVVYAPEPLMLLRLIDRDGFTFEWAQRRISSQMPIEEKKKRADYVIDNSGSLKTTKKQVRELLKKLI